MKAQTDHYVNYINSIEELKNVETIMQEKREELKTQCDSLLEQYKILKKEIESLSLIEEEARNKILALEIAQKYDKGSKIKELASFYHMSQDTINRLIAPYSERYQLNHKEKKLISNQMIMGYEKNRKGLKIYYYDGSSTQMYVSKKELPSLERKILKEALIQIRNYVKQSNGIKLNPQESLYIKRWKKDLIPCLDILEEYHIDIMSLGLFNLLKINQLDRFEYGRYIGTVKTEITKKKITK